jgi:hypothetical protein
MVISRLGGGDGSTKSDVFEVGTLCAFCRRTLRTDLEPADEVAKEAGAAKLTIYIY